MVRFSLSSAGWLCTIGLLTTAMPTLALPEGAIAQTAQPVPANVEQLLATGKQQVKKGDFEGAIATYQKALAIAQATNNLPQQIGVLASIGQTYSAKANDVWTSKNDYRQALKLYEQQLEPYQRALTIARKVSDRNWEMSLLRDIGMSYISQRQASDRAGQAPAKSLMQSQKSLQFLQQALAIAKETRFTDTKTILQSIFISHSGMAYAYRNLKQYDNALKQVALMYAIAKESGDPKNKEGAGEAESLIYADMREFYDNPEQYDKYIEVIQKRIVVMQRLNASESDILSLEFLIAGVYEFRGQSTKALAIYQKVLTRAEIIHAYELQFLGLTSMGSIYNIQANYPEALAFQEKALHLSRTQLKSLRYEGIALNNRGAVYLNQGNYDQALVDNQQSLAITQKYYERYAKGMTAENIREYCLDLSPSLKIYHADICEHPDKPISGSNFNSAKDVIDYRARSERFSMGKSFHNIARVYSAQGDYPKAAENNQKSLAIARELKDQNREATSFLNMSADYITLGEYHQARELVLQSLKIVSAQRNRPLEGYSHTHLGRIASEQGDYPTALKEYQQALTLSQTMKMRSREAILLSQIGNVYQSQGNYATALENYKKALDIQETIGEPASKIETLLKRGNLERQIGQPKEALATHQEALAIARKIGAAQLVAKAELAIATDHREQGQLDDALKGYNQALAIATSIDDLNAKPQALYGIGQLYAQQNQPDKALTSLNQALAIQQRTGVKPRQAETLSAIGQVQTQLGQYAKAQTTLQQAYVLAQTVGDRTTQAQTQAHLGQLYTQQNKPAAAIVFYKQSIQHYEAIRKGLVSLPPAQQQSYTNTISDTYRTLADLLITQNRLGEAEQILSLLKLQEIKDYAPPTRSAAPDTEVLLSTQEQAIAAKYNTLIALGQKLQACDSQNSPACTQLQNEQQKYTEAFNQFLDQLIPKVQETCTQYAEKNCLLPNDNFTSGASKLVQAQPGTLVISLFVVKDKVWILVASEGGIITRYRSNIDRRTLGNKIIEFRQSLKSPYSNLNELKATSKQLYDWLIRPIEPALNASTPPKNLIFALDRSTRYLPMGALFDGQQYLTQRYTISTVLSPESTHPQPTTLGNVNASNILALGLSEGSQEGDFSALPNVVAEVNSIVRQSGIYPGQKFLDRDFTLAAINQNIAGKKVLHLATHGKFVSSRQNESFLILGDKTKLPIEKIRGINGQNGFNGIELVVLSACESALGDPEQEGVEIPGLSSYFLNKGAGAVMASLWSVDDSSTALSMQQFYQNLATGKMTKAQAIQKVQQDLIQSKLTAKDVPRGSIAMEVNPTDGAPRKADPPTTFAHPYYWAPFILIGNSL